MSVEDREALVVVRFRQFAGNDRDDPAGAQATDRSKTVRSEGVLAFTRHVTRGNGCKLPVRRTSALGWAQAKRANASFAVSSMRVFGLCSLRAAFEASITSR
jgi:hypothetical protein